VILTDEQRAWRANLIAEQKGYRSKETALRVQRQIVAQATAAISVLSVDVQQGR